MPFKQITFDFSLPEDEKKPGEQEAENSLSESEPEELILAEESSPIIVPDEVTVEKKSAKGRIKLKDMATHADLIEVPEDEVLFQKSYYSIGKVAEMFKVNISLIRFWENEFDILKPKKNAKGDRFFRPEDVKNLKLIYHLLRERKYTIEGAKDYLKKNKKTEATLEAIESLKKLKLFLQELKANL